MKLLKGLVLQRYDKIWERRETNKHEHMDEGFLHVCLKAWLNCTWQIVQVLFFLFHQTESCDVLAWQKLPSFHSWHCFWSSGSADAAPFPHGSHFNRVSFSWRRMRQRAACCAAKASVLLTGNLDVICLICESVTGVWPWSKVVASAAVMNNLPYGIDASQRHFFFCT